MRRGANWRSRRPQGVARGASSEVTGTAALAHDVEETGMLDRTRPPLHGAREA